VLASVARQTTPPREIIIADDGSGAPTLEGIDTFARQLPAPVRVVSQPHEGFRVARLRNLAIAASTSDYLVFIDGDMLLHPEFMADHVRVARPGYFTQGVRAHADAALTSRLIAGTAAFPGLGTPGLGGLRRAYLLRSPSWSILCGRVANAFVALKACNLAAWRDDLVQVNGFDEDMVGWGPEDKECVARLMNAGVQGYQLRFSALATHLYHPTRAPSGRTPNDEILDDTLARRRTWCESGLDQHLSEFAAGIPATARPPWSP
jgi:glycosyltransferase involved in cell wall biosynthesis